MTCNLSDAGRGRGAGSEEGVPHPLSVCESGASQYPLAHRPDAMGIQLGPGTPPPCLPFSCFRYRPPPSLLPWWGPRVGRMSPVQICVLIGLLCPSMHILESTFAYLQQDRTQACLCCHLMHSTRLPASAFLHVNRVS